MPLLGSCGASSPPNRIATENRQSIESFIIIGTTTKNDVLGRLGEPEKETSTGSATLRWKYHYLKLMPGLFGSITKSKNLEIDFNDDGVVTDYKYTGYE
jgi:hypothetical protein